MGRVNISAAGNNSIDFTKMNIESAFPAGFLLTGIDKDHKYFSQAGQTATTQNKYNHAGTLITSLRPADVPNTNWWAASYYVDGFIYWYGTLVRLYNASGTLIRQVTLTTPYSNNGKQASIAFNGDKIFYQTEADAMQIRYYSPTGTYQGALNVPVGYGVNLMINQNKTIVTERVGDSGCRFYMRYGSTPVNATNVAMFDPTRFSI